MRESPRAEGEVPDHTRWPTTSERIPHLSLPVREQLIRDERCLGSVKTLLDSGKGQIVGESGAWREQEDQH